MKDIRNPGTLFNFNGKPYESIGYWKNDIVVTIQPVRESDYAHCECGKVLPSQQECYALSAPNLQENIQSVYETTNL